MSEMSSQTVRELFPEGPKDWHDWPCRWSVGFNLTPWTCYTSSLLEEYDRQSLTSILRTLFDPKNQDIYLFYQLVAVGFTPALKWYARWPIARRGKAENIERRGSVDGIYPWENHSDPTLLEISNTPFNYDDFCYTGPFHTKFTMRVGGRTKEEVTNHWIKCVRPVRRLKREYELL